MNSIDTFDNQAHDNETKENHVGGEKNMGKPALKEQVEWQTEDLWVTTGRAKQMLGVSSVNTVKRWVSEGKLNAQKIGSNNWMRISVESIKQLLRSGDKNVQAFRKLKQRIDEMSDLDFDVTQDDLDEMSDRRTGSLPWEK